MRSQRKALMKRSMDAPQIHMLFGRMHGTQRAAPLLRSARALHARAEVRAVLDEHMRRPPPRLNC